MIQSGSWRKGNERLGEGEKYHGEMSSCRVIWGKWWHDNKLVSLFILLRSIHISNNGMLEMLDDVLDDVLVNENTDWKYLVPTPATRCNLYYLYPPCIPATLLRRADSKPGHAIGVMAVSFTELGGELVNCNRKDVTKDKEINKTLRKLKSMFWTEGHTCTLHLTLKEAILIGEGYHPTS